MNALKDLRLAKGFTLKQLSEKSGVGLSTINNFENGKTSVSSDVLKKLSTVLKVDPLEISKLEGAKNFPNQNPADSGLTREGFMRGIGAEFASPPREISLQDYLSGKTDEMLMSLLQSDIKNLSELPKEKCGVTLLAIQAHAEELRKRWCPQAKSLKIRETNLRPINRS